jgi:hypothetical protein
MNKKNCLKKYIGKHIAKEAKVLLYENYNSEKKLLKILESRNFSHIPGLAKSLL